MSSERQAHNENNPWWGEHLHRYQVAINYLSPNARVLDIACGNGFGSYMMSQQKTSQVIGGDISEETIFYCKNAFPVAKNLDFQVMDGTKTGFANAHFDTVISFETIEHTTQYKEMLRELERITKGGGIFIVSTPNKSVSSPDGIVKNPYHTQEFTYDELLDLLKKNFDDVILYGQQYIRYRNSNFKNKLAQLIENTLYLRGVRKLPIRIQDFIMRSIIGKPMYPTPSDYNLTANKEEVMRCKTFFAICKKNG